MNERIKELRKQAIDFCLDKGSQGNLSEEVATKFAELIVAECVEQVWYSREDGINGNISEVIKERMKQHFGVENGS